MDLNERRDITAATLERFAGKPFAFGTCDCGLMVISHLKAMGWPIRTGGTWKTATALRRFLNRHGGTGAACIDGWGLPRIAPAAVIIGDIVEIEGEAPFGAFAIAVGNGRIMAFHEDAAGVAILQPTTPPLAAWRT
jgi:hypothetical protein